MGNVKRCRKWQNLKTLDQLKMKQSADRWIMVANQEMKQLLTELLIYLSHNENF